MRTTLSLDDDLAVRLAELSRESRKPFKAVVNEAIRRGLGEMDAAEAPFVLRPHPGRLLPGIDDRKLNELAWESDRASTSSSPEDRKS